MDVTLRKKLAAHAIAIKRLWRRTVAGGVEIGRHLQQAKDEAGHGNWLEWLQREFEWSESTALRFIRLFKSVRVEKSVKMTDLVRLPMTVATLVVAPSTPQAARQEIIARVADGKRISVGEARTVIQEVRVAYATREEAPRKAVVVAFEMHAEGPKRLSPTDVRAGFHASELGRWVTESARAIPQWSRAEHGDDDADLAAAVAKLAPDQQTAMAEIIAFVVRLAATRRLLN